jgi:hypothetical protein
MTIGTVSWGWLESAAFGPICRTEVGQNTFFAGGFRRRASSPYMTSSAPEAAPFRSVTGWFARRSGGGDVTGSSGCAEESGCLFLGVVMRSLGAIEEVRRSPIRAHLSGRSAGVVLCITELAIWASSVTLLCSDSF